MSNPSQKILIKINILDNICGELMNSNPAFIRFFFALFSMIFLYDWLPTWKGAGLGGLFGLGLIGCEPLFKRYNLRAFNTVIIGILLGYLMRQALLLFIPVTFDPFLSLLCIYVGVHTTLRASDEFSVSIPFIRFYSTAQKKKDLIVDASVLTDPRIIDLASSGILDHHLIIPRFLIKEINAQESPDKRAIETIKKLEALPELHLRYSDTDFPDSKDPMNKTIRLARFLEADILSADITRVQMSAIEGVRIINIHTLSNALKPLMQAGENIKIKIQRFGKEPRQGVGYLEDGTMVVVNGGGSFIGETIDAQVLSVKHTASGRMVFCNVLEEEMSLSYNQEYEDR